MVLNVLIMKSRIYAAPAVKGLNHDPMFTQSPLDPYTHVFKFQTRYYVTKSEKKYYDMNHVISEHSVNRIIFYR